MQGVENLVTDISKEKAKREWKRYCELIKTHPDNHAKTLKKAYYALSQGHQIIDIYEAFKIAGKHSNDKPRLAIAKASLQKVVFERRTKGAGAFYDPYSYSWSSIAQVELPKSTFSDWQMEHWNLSDSRWRNPVSGVETVVPIIPAKYYPQGQLKRYYILWETEPESWELIPDPPKDPMLLRRISKNLFAVLAVWDLTKLERAVIRGALLS